MSTRATSKSRKHRKPPRQTKPRTISDPAVYGGMILIGGFILLLWFLINRETIAIALIGFIGVVGYFVTHSTFMAWRGETLRPWRKSLARLPLRPMGYGGKGEKPVEAVHDEPAGRTATIISAVVTIVIVGALAAWLLPGAIASIR